MSIHFLKFLINENFLLPMRYDLAPANFFLKLKNTLCYHGTLDARTYKPTLKNVSVVDIERAIIGTLKTARGFAANGSFNTTNAPGQDLCSAP